MPYTRGSGKTGRINLYPSTRKPHPPRPKMSDEERKARRHQASNKYREKHRDPNTPKRLKHGHSRTATSGITPTYWSWWSMRRRCLSTYSKDYPRYGGRGIVICSRWLESFNNFPAGMGERPPGRTLDRVNGDGNYELDNCRWATPKEQASHYREFKKFVNNTSGHTGVYWCKKNSRWYAKGKTYGRHNGDFLGYFDTIEEAIAARELSEKNHA